MTRTTANAKRGSGKDAEGFFQALTSFAADHKTQHWSGTFATFLNEVVPDSASQIARSSHAYIWDMLNWYAANSADAEHNSDPRALFHNELFGVDEALNRVVEYFKAASAGSDVGRRLLLLLGPPSGGKSSVVILIKRALEEYSRTQAGAMYAIDGCPIKESPLHLIPHSMRPEFRNIYNVDIQGELCPHCAVSLEQSYDDDFTTMPVRRLFISEANRSGVGTYAPHDPSTADVADLVGSVDLSKVAEIGDEGDPRAWSWSGAVYAASRGVLEMIEILKVKREFLYLLLTLTQEKNVKVSRFPLIHVDETVIAHTNLAEFRRFLQEKENEALLDRMVIVQIPYALSYQDEAKIYAKLIANARTFQTVHLDPHALNIAAVFAVLTRLKTSEREDLDLSKKVRLYASEAVQGYAEQEIDRVKAENPDEGLTGVSPRFVVNALSNAITRAECLSLTSMEVLLALKDAIESDARMDGKQKRAWMDFLVLVRQDFYNRWVKEDVHKALFTSFENEAQELLNKYLDEVEAALDHRKINDPITNDSRAPDERFLRSVEEKIKVTDSGKDSFRQEVVRKAMVAFKAGEKFTLDDHERLHEAIEQYLFEERRDVLRLVTSSSRPDDDAQQKITAVQQRLVAEHGYDEHSAKEALNYVTTLMAQE
jgi:serine protein kinase